jgi:hypothetical protein
MSSYFCAYNSDVKILRVGNFDVDERTWEKLLKLCNAFRCYATLRFQCTNRLIM